MARTALQSYFHQSERWSRAQVLDLQWRKLKFRLEHLYRTNPYH